MSGKSAKKLRREYHRAVGGITQEAVRLVIDDLARSRGLYRWGFWIIATANIIALITGYYLGLFKGIR